MKRFKRLVGMILAITVVIIAVPQNAHAASYDDISRKFSGYGVSMSTKSDVTIGNTWTVTSVINNKSYAVTNQDTFTITKSITFSAGCSSKISESIL